MKGLPSAVEVVERESAEYEIELRDPNAVPELFLNGYPADPDR